MRTISATVWSVEESWKVFPEHDSFYHFMKVSDLRGILTYIPGFREKTFVIALDGAIIADDNFPNIMLDLAVLRSLSIRLVLVHGAAHQLRELAEQTKVPISNADGTGITDEETLKLALTAANRITHEVLEGLASNDLRACYTNAVIAHPYGIVGGVDRLYTGRVERVDTEFLNQLLEKGVIPVVAPLGFDGEGRTFRVNSDGVAMEVAEALKAAKLIYMTTSSSFLKKGRQASQMSVLCFLKNSSASATEIWLAFWPFLVKPLRLVTKMSFEALSASATSRATPSELTRKVRPSPSKPSGAMTGMTPFSKSWLRNSVSTRSTRPV